MTEASDQPVPNEGRMSMIEHLTELRRRLIIGFISIGVGAIAAWILYPWIIELLLDPYCRTLEADEECQLYVRNPLEPFSVRLTVAGYGGIIFAMPMILWQLWAFVAPGLYSHEKRYALPFIFGALILFFSGAGLAYWSIPRALDFLTEVGGDDFTSLFAPGDYLGFVIKMIVAFGVAFEFPIVLIFLQILGILEFRTLVSGRHRSRGCAAERVAELVEFAPNRSQRERQRGDGNEHGEGWKEQRERHDRNGSAAGVRAVVRVRCRAGSSVRRSRSHCRGACRETRAGRHG